MKKENKKVLFAFLTIVLVVALCLAITSCGDNPTESTPIATMPGESTTSTVPTATTADTTAQTAPTASTSTAATTTQETTTTVTPPVVGSFTNPLSGMPITKDLSQTRPVAIVVDNIKSALANQTGLNEADILYEALVAPGITRFLAVYADYTAVDSVCNIRSGRDYHMDLAAFQNAVLVCHGGSKTTNYDFYELAKARYGSRWGYVDTMFEAWFCQAESGKTYGTIDHNGDRPNELKYDTIFKPNAFTALLKSSSSKFINAGGTMVGSAKNSLKFVPYGTTKSMAGASAATSIALKFDTKNVGYTYDALKDKYLRTQEGVKHVDSESGAQISFTNVIVLYTSMEHVETGIKNDPKMTIVETVGTGTGCYFYGGKVINITWNSDGNRLTLTDALGRELTLATGNTYIGYVNKNASNALSWQ